jgi:hypothetical protein
MVNVATTIHSWLPTYSMHRSWKRTLRSWSPLRIVGITGDSMNPSVQDPDAQARPDAWITKIRDYMKDTIIPDEYVSAERIVHIDKRYTLVEGDIYQHGTNGVLMWCITQEDDCELLAEIHGGECGNHASSRTLVSKAFRHGFYWPTALQDAIKLVKRCKACQFHANRIQSQAQMLQIIPPSWSFAMWGLDILGPFPRAIRGFRYLYVIIDKFTKWPKATPVVKINKQSTVKFIKSVICRFGVMNRIITDMGPSSPVACFKNTARILASKSAMLTLLI